MFSLHQQKNPTKQIFKMYKLFFFGDLFEIKQCEIIDMAFLVFIDEIMNRGVNSNKDKVHFYYNHYSSTTITTVHGFAFFLDGIMNRCVNLNKDKVHFYLQPLLTVAVCIYKLCDMMILKLCDMMILKVYPILCLDVNDCLVF